MSEVIVVGDFNIELLKIKEKPVFSEYFEKISAHGIFPRITFLSIFFRTLCYIYSVN